MRILALLAAITALTGCSLECNGAAALCDRRFDEVTFATTHNAMSSEDEGWVPPNQGPPMRQQLEDGVRAMMLDVHEDAGELHLCHGNCGFGKRRLADALAELRTFLEEHPGEVFAIQFETYVTPARLAEAFALAKVTELLHAQAAGAPWPTLREMIENGRRIVVFSESDGGEPGWNHALFTWSFDTPYAAKSKDDLKCTGGRGKPGASLFTVNHFLTNPLASRELARTVNRLPFLLDRVRACEQQAGHRANFVSVDFYDESDLLRAVRSLNGLD